MSKRLQVLLDEADLRTVQRAARAEKMTVAEWVRQALKAAWSRQPTGDVGKKLEVIRAAARHSYPTAEIHQMLAQIEAGYGVEPRS